MTPPADTERYTNHRFPGEIISHGGWLYYRFTLSYREYRKIKRLFHRPLPPAASRAPALLPGGG